MEDKVKLDAVRIAVPLRGPGNTIRQKEVEFDVYRVDSHFEAVPTCSVQDRILANIPAQLAFEYRDGRPRSLRPNDGNRQVIHDLVEELVSRSRI
jgi:hypothetical protein